MNNNLPMVVLFRNAADGSGISSNESSHSLNLVTEISEMDDSPSFMEKDGVMREFGMNSLVERMALPEYFNKAEENEYKGVETGAKLSNSDYAYFDSNANQYRFMLTEDPVRGDPINYSNPPAAEIVVTNSDYAYLDAEKEVKPEYKMVSGANEYVIASPSDPWMLRPFTSPAHPQKYHKYTAFGLGAMPPLSYAGSNTDTIHINDRIPSVFNRNYYGEYKEMEKPTAPHNETLNKLHLNCESQAELANLNVVFEEKKKTSVVDWKVVGSRSNETMNKGLIGQDSLYDLQDLPAMNSLSEYGLQVVRDWDIQSLEELRNLPNNFEIKEEHLVELTE